MKDYTRRSYRPKNQGTLSGSGLFPSDGLFRWIQGMVRPDHATPSLNTILFSVCVIMVGGLLAFQVVWQQVQLSGMEQQMVQLEQQRLEVRDDIRAEKTEVARLQSLDRIGHLAMHELGMRPGLETQVVEVKQTRRVELPFEHLTDAPGR